MSIPYADGKEPTNAQLAAFMTVYARSNPRFKHLAVSPAILEHIFEIQPQHRANALRQHRELQLRLHEEVEKRMNGELQCQHVSKLTGKRCPNFNMPGTHFCGLHQDDEEDDVTR